MKTKILHLTFDMRIGGTEQVIKNIIEGSDHNLFNMSIYCIEQPIGPFGQILMDKGISISGMNRRPGFDVKAIKRIREYIKQHDINILHCHQYTPWVYGVLAALGINCKVIFTEHGRFYPDRTSWKRRLFNPLLTHITDQITVISKATKEALVKFEFIPADKIQLIYNGIQPLMTTPEKVIQTKKRYGLEDFTIILGTIARLDPIKNHVMMLLAFKEVLELYPNSVLMIVGDGNERKNLEQLAKNLVIEDFIIFTGYIPEPQDLLSIMDIFLLSSLSEGTSMTLLEAMSLSKPCVVTDAGGNREIIGHRKNGLVTPINDVKAFAIAIIELIENTHEYQNMSKASLRLFKEKFSSAHMIRAFQKIYQEL